LGGLVVWDSLLIENWMFALSYKVSILSVVEEEQIDHVYSHNMNKKTVFDGSYTSLWDTDDNLAIFICLFAKKSPALNEMRRSRMRRSVG
jgi:hypothetical protein